MKKLLAVLLFLGMSVFLIGCQEKTYDDVLLEYTNYIEQQQAVYEARVDFLDNIHQTIIYAAIRVKSEITELNTASVGSGVIFDEDDDYYYALTNSHVIGADLTYEHIVTVEDVYGNTYDATIKRYAAEYDLAVIQFEKGSKTLYVMPMASENLTSQMSVTVLGHPDGQINAITMGDYIEMRTVDLDTTSISRVEFPVMKLDVPVQSGSSGSMVVNENAELIGVIYAGSFTGSSDTIYSYAIAIESVVEFLNTEAFVV